MRRRIAVRYVRIEEGALTAEEVRQQHSRDKLISVFAEERLAEWRQCFF